MCCDTFKGTFELLLNFRVNIRAFIDIAENTPIWLQVDDENDIIIL